MASITWGGRQGEDSHTAPVAQKPGTRKLQISVSMPDYAAFDKVLALVAWSIGGARQFSTLAFSICAPPLLVCGGLDSQRKVPQPEIW